MTNGQINYAHRVTYIAPLDFGNLVAIMHELKIKKIIISQKNSLIIVKLFGGGLRENLHPKILKVVI